VWEGVGFLSRLKVQWFNGFPIEATFNQRSDLNL
jgi:hypothetical protein